VQQVEQNLVQAVGIGQYREVVSSLRLRGGNDEVAPGAHGQQACLLGQPHAPFDARLALALE
jgi:hypothetical protein